MAIEKGNIYVLPLEKKITEHNLLIFNIDGQSARLHISELSNNFTLSQRMFELFEKGQEVAVVVLDFNKEKKYFELSTKAFRNSLDDTLSFNQCENIVRREFKEYADLSSRHIQQYRAILDRLRGDLSSTGLTFLYELLQNAVDHPNSNFNNEVSVHFEIFRNYLLLKHNGALFTENNFRSITGILFGEEDDEGNVRRIGYKGIGFKSVFRHSTNVYVRSGNFSFAFTKETGDDKPWEVMPVFQNEIDKINDIQQFDFFNAPVAFALKFPNDESKADVINHLRELSENPYLLIFLNSLIKLKITLPDEEIVFEKESVSENGQEIMRLKQSNGTTSDWLKFSGEYQIVEEEIIAELTDTNNTAVPSNFRKFRTPKIDIIIPKEHNDNLVNLFTYLPMTNTQYQLPYIVNGDFIPNLDRTNLIPTLKYNYKIAEFVAKELLKSCVSLSKNKQYEYLKKLIPTYELENNRYASTVKEYFINEVAEHAIFPTSYENNLIELENLIVDQTGLQNVLCESDYSSVFNTQKKPLATNFGTTTEIEYLIEKTGQGSCFTVEDLTDSIADGQFQKWLKTPKNNAKFIKHIIENEELKELLKEPIFLTNLLELKKSKEIYYKKPSAVKGFNVDTLHDKVLSETSLGDINFKKYVILNFLVELLSSNEEDNKVNIKRDWEWVFDNWNEIKDDRNSKINLRHKFILCKEEQKIAIQDTYVSDEFQIDETNKIETIISSLKLKKHLISADFISEQRPKEEWLKLFKELEAKANLQDVITDIIENLEEIKETKHLKIGKEIFKFWNKKLNNENNLQPYLETLQSHLKIKTLNQNYCIPSKTIISDHYLTGTPLKNILPSIILQNGISYDYDKKGSNINWFNFFKEVLNCRYISQTQDVFDTKVEYYIDNQIKDCLRVLHFDFLQDLDNILNNNKSINFSKYIFNELQLMDTEKVWRNSHSLFLPSTYRPKLDLQSDNSIEGISFLNNNYKKKNISKKILVKIGVLQEFKLVSNLVKRNDLSNDYKLFWDKNYNYIRNNAEQYFNQHRVKNHISSLLNIELLKIYKYAVYFWKSLNKTSYNAKLINTKSIYETSYKSFSYVNFFVFSIQKMKCFPNKKKELCIPSFLYSSKLEKYISNPEILPLINLSEIINDNNQSIESTIGIQQSLNQEIALNLISESRPNLLENDVEFLDLINILKDADLDSNTIYYLPNINYEWKPISELFKVDEEFGAEIENSKKLHHSFEALIDTFLIKNLSENNLERKIEEENDVSENIIAFFNNRAKYIAYKTDKNNWEETEEIIKNNFKKFIFYECSKIKFVFPSPSPIEVKESNFIKEDDSIYFTGFWKNNNELITFLYNSINSEALPEVWFKNLIVRWEVNEIIEKLKDDFGCVPESWEFNDIINPVNEESDEPIGNLIFEDDVNEFIKKLEDDAEWNKYVPDLKNLITLATEHPREKQKLFNLMAKVKLAKQLNIHFDSTSNDYNKLEKNEQKYIVHSARGAFAYIHPSEILKMENEGYKMALDFNTKSPIKIYDTAKEILMLNKTHILAYRGEKNFDELISFCKSNCGKNKHLLIIDKANAGAKSKALSKLLNMEDDYR